MDPAVQVAFISVMATFVTTLGVVAVAVINSRKGAHASRMDVLNEARIQDLEIQVVDCERHIFSLEQRLARAGMEVPARPDSLATYFTSKKGSQND